MTLEERREANVGKQEDNANLPAGSPMYYYCRSCGAHTATLPEDWYRNPPPKFCDECRALPLAERTSYNDWLREHDHPPVPS